MYAKVKPRSPADRVKSFIQWISWFLSAKGNEYFCEVEEDYILDRFNLTGLNNECTHYSQALDLITDSLGMLYLMCDGSFSAGSLKFSWVTVCLQFGR